METISPFPGNHTFIIFWPCFLLTAIYLPFQVIYHKYYQAKQYLQAQEIPDESRLVCSCNKKGGAT